MVVHLEPFVLGEPVVETGTEPLCYLAGLHRVVSLYNGSSVRRIEHPTVVGTLWGLDQLHRGQRPATGQADAAELVGVFRLDDRDDGLETPLHCHGVADFDLSNARRLCADDHPGGPVCRNVTPDHVVRRRWVRHTERGQPRFVHRQGDTTERGHRRVAGDTLDRLQPLVGQSGHVPLDASPSVPGFDPSLVGGRDDLDLVRDVTEGPLLAVLEDEPDDTESADCEDTDHHREDRERRPHP